MNKSNSPYVICHMMQTIDGKIASGVEGVDILMDYFDLYASTEQKHASKAWMFGRKTGQAFAEGMDTQLLHKPKDIFEKDYVALHEGDRFAIITDLHGVLRWQRNYVNLSDQDHNFHLIIIVNLKTPKAYLAYLHSLDISYIFAGETLTNLSEALQKLKSLFGIEKLLLEGGGSFNGSMMAEGLIDEISLLLLPRVLNKKDAPSLFNWDTFKINTTEYQLTACTPIDRGVVWLKYKRN